MNNKDKPIKMDRNDAMPILAQKLYDWERARSKYDNNLKGRSIN